jgi:signal transduction histidine kinase
MTGGFRASRTMVAFQLLFCLWSSAAIAPAGASPPATNSDAAKPLEGLIENARKEMLVSPDAAFATAARVATGAQSNLTGRDRERYLVEAEAVQGQAMIRLGDLDRANILVQRAIKRTRHATIPPKVYGDLLLSSGQIATRQNDVQTALRRFQRAYTLFRSAKETRWQAIALQSIAQLYIRGGDSDTALKYYAQSNDEYAGDPLFSLSNRNNQGNAYLQLFKPADAEREFRLAEGHARQLDSVKYLAIVLVNLAQAQLNQGHLDAASTSINRAIAAARAGSQGEDTWQLWDIRAQLAYKRHNLSAAASYIDRVFAEVTANDSSPAFRQAHDTAYQIYRDLGRDKLALAHLEATARIDYEAAKLTVSTSAALMAARFDFANQDLKISQLKAAELEKSIAYERARSNLLIVVVIGSILLGLLLIVGLILITRSRNRERAAKLVLAETNRELEKAIAAKMEFLATTSHEIRTPLNGILGMTQVMLSDRKLDATLRDRIGIVHSAGENMRTLVDDILDVAKMETGKLAVGTGTIELKATLLQVAKVWRLQAEAAGVGLLLNLDDCPEQIEGDGGRLRQIVFNLLSNAMKFTDKGKVELSVKTVDDRVRIAVRDSGIGIAREWHESIFELFQQVDGGTTRQYGGTGLGLAICRNLARAMGGDIWVDSEPGFGSTFTIDLPCVEIDASALRSASASDRPSTVLVIERNPLARGILRAILSERFDVVAFVGCDAEAIDYLAHEGVNWLVADVASVDSYDALMAATQVPMILVEGTATAPATVRQLVQAVLTKPISKSTLLAAFTAAEAPVAAVA